MESQIVPDQFEEQSNESSGVNILEILGFVIRSARRHRLLGVGVGVGILSVGLLASRTVPQRYQSESRILIEESSAKTAYLSSNDRWRPNVDSLGESTELVLRKGSLESIVEEAELPAVWEANRPTPIRIRDKIVSTLLGMGPISEADKVDALVRMLASRIQIARDKNIVSIRAQWQDPATTCRLAKLVESRLLESLQTQEFSSINAAISLLEEQAKNAAELIPPALNAVSRIRNRANAPLSHAPAAQRAESVQAAAAPAIPGAATGHSAQSPAKKEDQAQDSGDSEPPQPDKKLAAKLSQIREQIKTVEAPWQRHLAELKLQLSEMQVTYGPEHPLVVQQEGRIRSASEPPPELQELRGEEHRILTNIEETGNAGASGLPSSRSSSRPSMMNRDGGGVRASATPTAREEVENPELIAAMAQLHSAIKKYGDLAERAGSARLELTTAQVEFRRRYVVVSEPEVPRKPVKPLQALIALGSLLASILFGILSGALREIASGRIRESWQIEALGLPILGELRLPDKTE
jgi:uncharacterized protein involved in exopolysaccharide biosynthesis